MSRSSQASKVCGGLLLVLLSAGACSNGTTASPPSTTSQAGAPPTITQPDGQIVPPASVAAASAEANNALSRVGGDLTLDDAQRACVAAELDKDPGLRDGLGDKPSSSPRWNEVTKLASDCVTKTSFASTFASNIGRSIPGATPVQVACLRDSFPRFFTTEDVAKMSQAAINPGSVPGAEALRQRMAEWIGGCGLAQPPTPGFDVPATR